MYPGWRDGFGEIVIAQILIRCLHVGLNDRYQPLSDDLEILISVHATHIGLCTFLGMSLS